MTKVVLQDVTQIAQFLREDLLRAEEKNIVIAGATGMLASYLVYTFIYANEHFLKLPAQIYLLTRNTDKKFGVKPFLHYTNQDITKELKLPKMHYIIHAASKASPKFYSDNMIDTLNTNILGLYSLLKLCNKRTKSFLYFSSAEIYGDVFEKPVEESYSGIIDHVNKRSCYVEAKKASEAIAMNYFWEKQVPIKIARIFHTFGPGLNLNDGRVFSDFIRFGLEKKNVLLQGDPTLQRSMLYIKDATIMFLKILFSNNNGQIYNVGSEKNIISIRDFADLVCSTFNTFYKNKIHVVVRKNKKKAYYKHAVKCIKPSLDKFKKDFNYEPTTTLEQMVNKTITHFLEFNN